MSSNNKEIKPKTAGELERQLTQDIRVLHLSKLGYAPEKISCHLFGNQLAVVLEDSILPVEQMFLCNGHEKLAKSVRLAVERLLRPLLINLIQDVLSVNVDTILSDSCSRTKITGIITVLEKTPNVRNPEAIPKTKLFKKGRLRTREIQP